jgi:hypothetical protein
MNRSNAEQLTSWRILEQARDERRRVARHKVDIPARIDVGGALLDCKLVDISELGAKLRAEAVHLLPDSFLLVLTRSGHLARRCRVCWRTDKEVGVEFLPQHASEHQRRNPGRLAQAALDCFASLAMMVSQGTLTPSPRREPPSPARADSPDRR